MRTRKQIAWMMSFLLLAIAGRLWALPESLGGVTLQQVMPRIITPNGDSRNDVIFFKFDTTLTGLPIESSILDLSGAEVANLTTDAADTSLIWDGKDSSGRILPAGVYIYSIKIGKNLATGTVIVAR